MKKKKDRSKPETSRRRWAGEGVLQAVGRMNGLILAQLSVMARSPSAHAFPLLDTPLWWDVDSRACERVARCPVLLVDLDFESPQRWRAMRTRILAPERKSQLCLFPTMGAKLLREILLEARTHARSAPYAVQFGFGMAPEVSRAIADFSIDEIDRLADLCANDLRIRWSDHLSFWIQLIKAVCGTNDAALATVWLHAVQMLGGDFALQEFREHSAVPRSVVESRLRH